MTVEVRVVVTPRAAILARKTCVGTLAVTVTDQDLQELPEVLLEELASVVEQRTILEGLQASEATFAVVRALLEARLEARATRAAEEALAETARRGVVARDKEEEEARRRQEAARVAASEKAVDAWVEEHGDDDQRERRANGFLPTGEIIEEIAQQMFEIDEDDYQPLRQEEACDCDKGCVSAVQFAVIPLLPGDGALDSAQFATLTRIKDAAPRAATVEARVHKARCPSCRCAPLARVAARVSLVWEGWLLTREYAL